MPTTVLAFNGHYPLLNLFWTMLWFFLWILWIFLLVRIITDIFRSSDMGGVAKAAWVLFVIILPFLGVLTYLLARGSDMHTREYRQVEANEDAFKTYVQQTAGTTSTAEELTKLAALKADGVLSESEFAAQKAKLLA